MHSNNNNVDSIDNYNSNNNNEKDIDTDASSLWRDKVEYVDLSSSVTTEITENGRSLPLFLLGMA